MCVRFVTFRLIINARRDSARNLSSKVICTNRDVQTLTEKFWISVESRRTTNKRPSLIINRSLSARSSRRRRKAFNCALPRIRHLCLIRSFCLTMQIEVWAATPPLLLFINSWILIRRMSELNRVRGFLNRHCMQNWPTLTDTRN